MAPKGLSAAITRYGTTLNNISSILNPFYLYFLTRRRHLKSTQKQVFLFD